MNYITKSIIFAALMMSMKCNTKINFTFSMSPVSTTVVSMDEMPVPNPENKINISIMANTINHMNMEDANMGNAWQFDSSDDVASFPVTVEYMQYRFERLNIQNLNKGQMVLQKPEQKIKNISTTLGELSELLVDYDGYSMLGYQTDFPNFQTLSIEVMLITDADVELMRGEGFNFGNTQGVNANDHRLLI